MHRSELTVDLGAVRRNTRTLLRALEGAQLWAVVKGNAYGHGAVDVAGAAVDEGAGALCVATVPEALELRAEFPLVRILVMGPEVVGLMSHLATADSDPVFAEEQVERFREATQPYRRLTRHIANSAAALRLPSSRFEAARCGIALYGLSPFGEDPRADRLEPALAWRSYLAQVKRLEAGESAGYGRRFMAERPTWIGIVPIGYADGFRRGLTGTEVRVGGELRRVVGTVSMDAFAVELAREEPVGAPVTILGHGVLAEDHARVAGTINYELVCGINSDPRRARRVVVDA